MTPDVRTAPVQAPTPAPGPVGVLRARQVLVDGGLRPATLVLAEGRVVAIEPYDAAPHDAAPADVWTVPDGHVVLPGVVDTHVHVNEPGRTSWEGFASATRAAARGGVTTVVDMPLNAIPPTTTVAGLEAKRAAATAAGLAVDVALWGGAVPGNVRELAGLWDAGVMGFKCFLSPSGVPEFGHLDDDAALDEHLREVARLDALMVVHAEDPRELEAAAHGPSRSYQDFLASRPDSAETAAIARLIDAVRRTGARTHLLHLSSARALDLLADARAEGLPLTVETCHHYLCFAAESIPDAAPQLKCCPPIRSEANRDLLWQALADGVIDCVVSDHSPSTAEEKQRGDGDLQAAWGGISGLEVGFVALADEARRRGVGLADVSRWTSAATARLVGLDVRGSRPAKGRIAVGSAADLLVYDPHARVVVDQELLAHRNPISAYHGRQIRGAVTTTVLGGRVLDLEAPAGGALLTRP